MLSVLDRYRDKCTDSKYWIGELTVWLQGFYTHKKIYNFTKSDVQNSVKANSENDIINVAKHTINEKVETFPVNNVTLYTTEEKMASNIVHWYAYKPVNDTIQHDDKNIIESVSGTAGSAYANKDATLYIYKSTQVSDFTTEYIGNITLDENGCFNLSNIQTREEISKETGDFTVAVAVKGETNAIITGTISAPKPESYTVTFVNSTDETDENGNIIYNTISEQNVVPGGAAELPDENNIPVKEGYHFVCWNLSTDIVNGNMTVQAIYDKNEYAVVFVDWDSRKLEIKKVKYGEPFTAPEHPKPADDVDVEWVIGDGGDENAVTLNEWIANGGTVTEDMIISARYTLKHFAISVIDLSASPNPEKDITEIENNNSDDPAAGLPTNNEVFKYDDILPLEEYEKYYSPDCIFMGWKNAATGEYLDSIEVESDMTIYPVFQFAETVEIPTASVATGEYDTAQSVTLSCDTETAVIYYTTDGSDPATSETATEYTAPITLTKSTAFQFCAMALGMNNSGTVAELYAINTATSGVRYHLVTVYSNLPQDEGAYYQALIKDSTKLNASAFGQIEGYTYNGLFTDAEGEDEFDANSDLIVSETTLYAIYTPLQFTATFEDYDGTQLGTSTVDYGTAAQAPDVPAREGYVFIGWDSDDYEYLTADKTFTAQYCPEDEYARISLIKSAVTRSAGDNLTLKYVITPAELSDTDVLWETNNPEVATVDQNGCVEFLSEGSATITVTVLATGENSECFVTVTPNPDTTLFLGRGSVLGIDEDRYLRGTTPDSNTVGAIREDFANEPEKIVFTDANGTVLSDIDTVGTGVIIKLMDGDTVMDEVIVAMTGDINGDGAINIIDATAVQKHAAEIITLEGEKFVAADTNGDGSVNVKDATIIQKHIAKLLEVI